LVVIADQNQLRPGHMHMSQQAGEVDVIGHARLVQDRHTALPQTALTPHQLAGQTNQRRRLDACPGAEVSGRLTGRRRAHHLTTGCFERCSDGGKQGRLPRPGHPHDQLGSPPRPADDGCGLALLSAEPAHLLPGLFDRPSGHVGGCSGGVGAGQVVLEAVGDRPLGGQDRGQGSHP
jgi:hypothetical protein